MNNNKPIEYISLAMLWRRDPHEWRIIYHARIFLLGLVLVITANWTYYVGAYIAQEWPWVLSVLIVLFGIYLVGWVLILVCKIIAHLRAVFKLHKELS